MVFLIILSHSRVMILCHPLKKTFSRSRGHLSMWRCGKNSSGPITGLCLQQQNHPHHPHHHRHQQPRSRTVDPFAAFCSLSLSPSSVWGQSPAEGQMVLSPPTGAVSIVYCSIVSFSAASFPRSSSSSYSTVGIQFTTHLHLCCDLFICW